MTTEDVARTIDAKLTTARLPDPLPDGCPVRAVGHEDGRFWFVDAVGGVRRFSQRDLMTTGVVLDLFNGNIPWLAQAYTRENRRGGGPEWDQNGLVADLVRACRLAGPFEADRVRGGGVWALTDGRLAVNSGASIMLLAADGGIDALEPGTRCEDHVYAAGWAEAPPAASPAGGEVIDLLRAVIDSWNWQSPAAPILLLGGLAAAMMPEPMPQRPVLYVIGPSGCGKSHVLNLFEAVSGPWLWRFESTTAPAIRRYAAKKRVAGTFLINELEAKEDNRPALTLIEVSRHCYDRSEGAWARAGDEAAEGKLDAMFVFAAVGPPPLDEADRNRMAFLELDDLTVDGAAQSLLDTRMAALRAAGPALRRRVLTAWPAFPAARARLRDRLLEAGHKSRGADTYGGLLAMAEIFGGRAIDDRVIEALPVIAKERGGAAEECWNWLLTSRIDMYGGGKAPISEIMVKAIDEGGKRTGGDWARSLNRYGLSLYTPRDEDGLFVAVATQHAGLAEIYQRTKWAGGGWVQALQQSPIGGRLSRTRVRFDGAGGMKRFAVLVPAAAARGVEDE